MAIDRCEIEAVLRKLLYGGLDLSEAADEITALASEYLRERDRYREALGELMDRSAVLAVLEDNQRQGYLKLLNAPNREE